MLLLTSVVDSGWSCTPSHMSFSHEISYCPCSQASDSSCMPAIKDTLLFLAWRCWQEMQCMHPHYKQGAARPLILGLLFVLPESRMANLVA